MAVKGSGASASGMVHLLAGFVVFTGVAGSTGLVDLAVRAGFVCFAGICAIACFTGLVDVAGLASLPSLIYFIGFTGFARLAVFAGLLALPALFLPERIKPLHPRAFFVVPPGWWGAVAGLPGSEADQVGAGLCELVDDRVCFGGGEVGGGPARRDDVLHSTALAGIEQHTQPILARLSVVELGNQVEAHRVGVVLDQLPLASQLELVAGRTVEDGDRSSARLTVQYGGGYRRRRMWLIWRIRSGLCCHRCPPLVLCIVISLVYVSLLSIDAQMDGKVQSGFCLTPGGNPQAERIGVARRLSAVRNIRLNVLGMSP